MRNSAKKIIALINVAFVSLVVSANGDLRNGDLRNGDLRNGDLRNNVLLHFENADTLKYQVAL